MRNPLLEFSWEDVRLLSVEGTEIVLTMNDETRRVKFSSAKELNDAFGEWCNAGKGQAFKDRSLAQLNATVPKL
jgi:hypothetical protein